MPEPKPVSLTSRIVAIILWVFHSLALFKLYLMDSWGTLHLGLGDTDIDITKILWLSFLPYLGITFLFWTWGSTDFNRFMILLVLIGTLAFLGLVAYFRLEYLALQNDHVDPNWTSLHICLAHLVLMGLVSLLFIFRGRRPVSAQDKE